MQKQETTWSRATRLASGVCLFGIMLDLFWIGFILGAMVQQHYFLLK